jgi:hypothetical protein
MEYETKTYFGEEEQDDVKGFTVLATDDGEYHIGEKWLKENGDSIWMDYWIPEAQLLRRVEDGACTPKGQLSDEQFAQVNELCGIDHTNRADGLEASA